MLIMSAFSKCARVFVCEMDNEMDKQMDSLPGIFLLHRSFSPVQTGKIRSGDYYVHALPYHHSVKMPSPANKLSI